MPATAPIWDLRLQDTYVGWRSWVCGCWGDLTRASLAAERLLEQDWIDILHRLRVLASWFVHVERSGAAFAEATSAALVSLAITDLRVGGHR